jgi:hypothetical protein
MKCKPGDMAFITQKNPDNVGKLVLVIEYFGEVDYPRLDLWKLPSWSVESMGDRLTLSTGQLAYGGHIPDLALRPLRQITVSRAELAQARARASKAAWENLVDALRNAARKQEAEAEALGEKDA